MSWVHLEAARPIQCRGGAPSKAVLVNLADRACEYCGLAWPGVKSIVLDTQVGASRVRAALDELTKDDLVRVHAYRTGGRARATEYVVVPMLVKLASEAPCRRCAANMRSPGGETVAPPPGRPRAVRGAQAAQPAGRPPVSTPEQAAAVQAALSLLTTHVEEAAE